MMDFSIFRELEQLGYFTKILVVVHGICIVIVILPFIEIEIRRIVIAIAALGISAYLMRFGYLFKGEYEYLAIPIIVLIADVLFIAWPYLPRPPSATYQQMPQPMHSIIGQTSEPQEVRTPAPDYPQLSTIDPISSEQNFSSRKSEVKSYRDFVALCARKEQETGIPCLIIASY